MALNAVHNERLECPKLLLDSLIRTVEFLLDVCAFKQSVYVLHSGLRYLHSRVKAILRHGAKIKHHLIYTQPSFAAFDTWLEQSLTDHSLIKTLYAQRQDVKTFYYDWAFLQDEILFKALLDCLHALATRDLDAVIDIPSEKIFVGNSSIQYPVVDMPFSGVPVSPTPNISFKMAGEQTSSNSRSIGTRLKSHNGGNNIQATGEAQTKIQYYMTDTEDESIANIPDFSYAYGSPATSPPNILQLPDAAVYPRVPINSALNVPKTEVLHSSEPKNESVGFESILKSDSEDSFVKPAKKTKSFLESGGYVEPPALGNFPLPQKGQSLTSFLSSLSETMPELDRENAHFNVSEALISAFERLKVQQKFAQIQEEERLKKIEDMFGTTVRGSFKGKQFYSGKRFPRPPIVHTETEESEFEYWKQQPRRPPPHLKKRQRFKKLGSEGQSESIISTTEATTSGSSVSSEDEDIASSSFSAENVALNLLRNAKMKDVHLPPACELRWLVSEHEAPQNLLPLPKNWTTSASESESDYSGNGRGSSVGVIDKTMRLRGTETWAPPRPQIIFTIHPPPNLNALMETQKYRCAGCGMKIDAKYTSTLRYCNYLGRYFCTGCHTLKKARLPQMILHKWDFSPYMVSNFSATLLESLQSDPVYNVMAINSTLNRKVKLNNFRNYRIQLGFLIDYLKNCKTATDLYKELDKFPTYYTADVDLYSLEDLINLRFSTGLPLKTKDFILRAIHHVLNCELCKNLGFVCELCNKSDILFPFQINRVSRCPKCASCFHLRCFHPGKSDCPKCLRLNIRRSTLTVSTAAIAV